MAKRRREKIDKQKEDYKKSYCPVCGNKLDLNKPRKFRQHMEKDHPEIYEDMKIEGLHKLVKEEKLSDPEKLDMANELFEDDEYDMVLELLKYLPGDHPELFEVFNLVAGAYAMMENPYEAEHYGKRSVDLKPEIAEFRYNLASTYWINNNLHSCIKEIEKIDISKVDRGNKDLIERFIKFVYNDLDEASREVGLTTEQYLESNRLFNDGYKQMTSGNYEESIRKFNDAIKINPESHTLYGNLGVAYLKLGDYKNARRYFKNALKIKPDYIYAQHNLETLENFKNNGESGVGMSTELLTAAEKKLVPRTELMSDNSESIRRSLVYYRVSDLKRVRKVLETNNEFEIIDQGEHFTVANWSRSNPNHFLHGFLPSELSEPKSVLGDIELCWDELRLSAMTRGRLRVLQNLLLDKCGLKDILELDDEYFEELFNPELFDDLDEDWEDDYEEWERKSKESTEKVSVKCKSKGDVKRRKRSR